MMGTTVTVTLVGGTPEKAREGFDASFGAFERVNQVIRRGFGLDRDRTWRTVRPVHRERDRSPSDLPICPANRQRRRP